jgi:hypothetical protein
MLSIILLAVKTVAKLTLCATDGKNRRRFGDLYRLVYCLAVEKRWKPCQG